MIEVDKTVLIVEDSPATSNMLTHLFILRGFTVEAARHGLEALDIMKRVTPDVIILDLMMPEMDGFKFCENIRENENYKDIPIVILSALKKEKYMNKFGDVKIAGYIEKPFIGQELIDQVLKVL